MPNSIKDQVTQDLQQAKAEGQLRAERVREILRNAVSQVASEVASEVKVGSVEIRSIVKDAMSAVIANLRESGSEAKEEITASIEGVVEGISSAREQALAKTQAEVKQLQAQLASEEEQLEQDVETSLVTIEEASQDAPSEYQESIITAIATFQESEEFALMKKRYVQLQAQLALLKANLTARYGGRHEEVKDYLDEAQSWYQRMRTSAEESGDPIDQKRTQLEDRFGEAGSAVARREHRLRKILSELLHTLANAVQEKPPSGT